MRLLSPLRVRLQEALAKASLRPRLPAAPLHLCHMLESMDVGGVAGEIVNLSNALNTDEMLVSCLCSAHRGYLAQRVEPRVQVWALHTEPAGVTLTLRAARLLARYAVDLLHVHSGNLLPWAVPAAHLARVAHVVCSGHGELSWGDAPRAGLVAGLAARRTDRLLADSTHAARAMSRRFGVGSGQVQVLPRAVDVDKFRPPVEDPPIRSSLGIRPDEVVLGMVRKNSPPEEIRALLSALAELSQQGVQARGLLVGPGTDSEGVLEAARDLGVAGKVLALGFVPDVVSMLSAMDIFVMPVLEVGGHSAVLEAMACGLPVVAFNRGEMSELVQDGETGLLVPPRSPRILARILVELATHPQRRRSLGQQGRQQVLQAHSLEVSVRRYREMVQQVVGSTAIHSSE